MSKFKVGDRPAKESYKDGKWYGWNGGACPVDKDTLVEVVCSGIETYKSEPQKAGLCFWGEGTDIVSFRIIRKEKPFVYTKWYGGAFYKSYIFFEGATHKLYDDMTVMELEHKERNSDTSILQTEND